MSIYGTQPDGDLLAYKHRGTSDGSATWAYEGKKVGTANKGLRKSLNLSFPKCTARPSPDEFCKLCPTTMGRTRGRFMRQQPSSWRLPYLSLDSRGPA